MIQVGEVFSRRQLQPKSQRREQISHAKQGKRSPRRSAEGASKATCMVRSRSPSFRYTRLASAITTCSRLAGVRGVYDSIIIEAFREYTYGKTLANSRGPILQDYLQASSPRSWQQAARWHRLVAVLSDIAQSTARNKTQIETETTH